MLRRERQLLRLLERERDAFAAERARMLDTICHLAGKPWTLPPRPAANGPVADPLELVFPGEIPDDEF